MTRFSSRSTGLKVLDLFCGAGGSSAGAAVAGMDVVRGVDAWPLAAKTFSENFGPGTGLEHTLTDNSDVLAISPRGIDILLASPECTNHSCAKGGATRDEESRRTAFHVIKFARELRPGYIVIENVVQFERWDQYPSLVASLSELGYVVAKQKLNAADFGAPQSRRRLYLLCGLRERPPIVSATHIGAHRPASGVLDPAGVWRSSPLYSGKRAAATLRRAERAVSELGEGVPFLIVYYGSDASGGWQRLDRPLRTMTTLDRFGLVEWEGDTPMLRMLQVPELKRAMGFPASFKLPFGTRREKVKLLGNAVCPPVMAAILRAISG